MNLDIRASAITRRIENGTKYSEWQGFSPAVENPIKNPAPPTAGAQPNSSASLAFVQMWTALFKDAQLMKPLRASTA